MEKRTVKFHSEGVRLEGDMYLPSDFKTGERRPGIVLCHGFTGLRDLILGDYAKVFVDAGFVALTFDYRGFGGSEGEKWRLIPLEQIDDIRNAISFFEAQPQVDPERIGLWGTSFGGANAPYAAARRFAGQGGRRPGRIRRRRALHARRSQLRRTGRTDA